MAEVPLGAGDPPRGPRQPISTLPFDVLTCLEGQTTSEFYETRTVVSVSKIAPQRFKSCVDPTSVLREKPRKPKETHVRRAKRRPMAEPPSSALAELGHSRAPQARSSASQWPRSPGLPCWAGDPLPGPRQPLSTLSFDVLTCLEGQTTSESYETRTVVSVSKTPLQRFKSRVDPTSVLQEKPQKPKGTR